MKEAIILLGAPGSGKGTQAKILAKRAGFELYTMSDLIRRHIEPGSDLYENVISKGLLLEDEQVCDIFEKEFKGEDKVLLDGIPRKEYQARWLHKFLDENEYDIKVLHLNVDKDGLLQRILLRAEKEGRSDDKEEVFMKRLEIYNHMEGIVLAEFDHLITEVNGDGTVEEVSKEIEEKLGE